MFPTDDIESQKNLIEMYSKESTNQLLAEILVELKVLNSRLAEVKNDGLMVKNYQVGEENHPLKIAGTVKSISYDMSW
jgi:Lhr-like helicase